MIIMGKNRNFRDRPQQGGQNNNNQQQQKAASTEQKPTNAPLANVVNSAPAVIYASEAELASLVLLMGKLEESATMFGDVAVEATQSIIAPIRALITTTGTISPEDQKQIEALKAGLEVIETNAGARSHIPAVADFAIKALEEGTDEICVKWREDQELIAAFGGEETQQMTQEDYKEAINMLAFQQVISFVFAPIDMEGCPEALVNIDSEFNAAFGEESEIETEESVQTQPAIAAV